MEFLIRFHFINLLLECVRKHTLLFIFVIQFLITINTDYLLLLLDIDNFDISYFDILNNKIH
jgi:hypothetical protein